MESGVASLREKQSTQYTYKEDSAMMVSTKGKYALMVMIDLAKCDPDKYISLAEIAERQNLSMKYLETLVAMLNKGGMLNSLRGKNGGYKLARNPEDYNISEILELTEGSLAPVQCVSQEDAGCENKATCVTLPLWVGLDKVIEAYLGNITLKDIAERNLEKIFVKEITLG